MSESIGYLGEQYEHLKAQIDEAEKAANNLPCLREKLAEVAERIKQYVSPQDTDSTETASIEPEIDLIEPDVKLASDITGVDYAPAFEGYQPNGSLPETE